MYLYALARGHYIVTTLSTGSSTGQAYIVYDGRSRTTLDASDYTDWPHLSADGTHYAYTVVKRASGATDIYVDGRLYRSSPGQLELFAVTNAGEPVYATATSPPSQAALYRGANVIATAPRGFLVVRISADGSHWLAYERSEAGGPGPLVLDGLTMLASATTFPDDQYVQLSDNGRHWSVYLQDVGSAKLIINGVTRSAALALGSLQLTDSGHVAWVDNVDGTAHVDDRVINGAGPWASSVLINDDASHTLLIPRDGLPTIDGAEIELGTHTAEVVGSTVYAYIFLQ